MTPYAYLAGQWAAVDRLGLTKLAAVPKAVLEAAEATGSFLGHEGAAGGKTWSLMGGEGGALTPELMGRISGKMTAPQAELYAQRMGQEVDKLMGARDKGFNALFKEKPPASPPSSLTPRPRSERWYDSRGRSGAVPKGTVGERPMAMIRPPDPAPTMAGSPAAGGAMAPPPPSAMASEMMHTIPDARLYSNPGRAVG